MELKDGDYTLVSFKTKGEAWFTIKEFSIRIHATDEGVIVDVWNKGEEDGDVVASTYAFDKELQ